MEYLKVVVLVMAFFSFAMTTVTYALPSDVLDQVEPYTNVGSESDLDNISNTIQGGLQSQTDIPVIEVGALVFYSGIFVLDLLLNFIMAIPEMIGLLIFGISSLFNFNSAIVGYVQVFASILMVALYVISIIQLVFRSRSGVVV